jgi:membrane-anchored protein YejM (alkaline phosphatase superfamily)
MTKLNFNFVQRITIPWVALGAMLIALAVCVNGVVVWMDLREQSEQVQARIDTLESELTARKLAEAAKLKDEGAVAAERSKEDEKITKALNYPWNRILSTFEGANTEGVAILSFTHDASTNDTRIVAKAIDVPALVRFVEKLNAAGKERGGSEWYLSSYQMQQQDNPVTVTGVVQQKK